MTKISKLLIVIFTLSLAHQAAAEVSEYLPIGGVLADSDGEPLNGPYDVWFSLYSAQGGDGPVWTEARVGDNQLEITDGLFSAYLGEVDSLDFMNLLRFDELWLGIRVGSDSEMNRIRLGAVPFALEAQYCRQMVDVKCEDREYLQGWDPESGAPLCIPLRVGFGDLEDVPGNLLDGDNDTTYTNGAGLILSGNEFSVIKALVEDWAALVAEEVCYDKEAELLLALDDDYVNEGQAGSVSNDMLAGDIAPEKITGVAWTGDSDGPGSDLNADLLDGLDSEDFAAFDHEHDGLYQEQYKRTIVVSQVGDGSDAVANGNALYDALDGIADASKTSPYLLKIEPGIYKVVDEVGDLRPLRMKPYVDVEGSGEESTRIVSVGWVDLYSGVVIGSDNAELRYVTVEAYARQTDASACALYTSGSAPRFSHVTARVFGGTASCAAVNNHPGSGSKMSWVDAYAECPVNCFAIRNNSSTVTMSRVTAIGVGSGSFTGGLRAFETDGTVRDSTFSGTSTGTGSVYGYRNRSSTLEFINVTAAASGGNNACAVSNESANLTANNSYFSASGGLITTYAISTDASSDSYSVKVLNSRVESTSEVAFIDSAYTMWFAGSLLDGDPPAGTGSLKCINVHDANLDSYTCP